MQLSHQCQREVLDKLLGHPEGLSLENYYSVNESIPFKDFYLKMSKFEEFSQHYFRRKRTHGRTAEPKVLKARRVKATAVPSVFQCKISVPADRLKKEEEARWVSNPSECGIGHIPLNRL